MSALGASKFCGQGQHAIISLFVKRGVIKDDDTDFHDVNDLSYLNSQLNFDAPSALETLVMIPKQIAEGIGIPFVSSYTTIGLLSEYLFPLPPFLVKWGEFVCIVSRF